MFRFQFKINLQGQSVHLKLFNGYNELLFSNYGEMDISVEKGIYILWIESNEHVEERKYRIDQDEIDQLDRVITNSSMPLIGMASTHEYFSEPTRIWSEELTISNKIKSGGNLFLFLRYEDEKIPFDESLALLKNFSLLDGKRMPILQFNAKNSKVDFGKANQYFGSIAFHSSMKNGQYFLVYKDKNISREIPLTVFSGFQTQVFLNVKEVPLFGSVKISISQPGFDGSSFQNQQLDSLILKMFNGIIVFPEAFRSIAQNGTWENLMLAFLGLYMYLLSSREKDISFYQKYIQHLEDLVPKDKDAPEFRALRLLASVVFKEKPPVKPLLYPTMIASGMQVFRSQSYENEKLIRKDSIVQLILDNLRPDSIWTTYEVLAEQKIKTVSTTVSHNYISKGSLGAWAGKGMLSSSFSRMHKRAITETKTIIEPFEDTKWITETILHELANPRTEKLNVKELAKQYQVTQHSIRKSLQFLKEEKNLKKMKKTRKGFENMDVSAVLAKI